MVVEAFMVVISVAVVFATGASLAGGNFAATAFASVDSSVIIIPVIIDTGLATSPYTGRRPATDHDDRDGR
jgi:hypothetical protein